MGFKFGNRSSKEIEKPKGNDYGDENFNGQNYSEEPHQQSSAYRKQTARVWRQGRGFGSLNKSQ